MKNLRVRTIKLMWKILKLQILLISRQEITEYIIFLYFVICTI